jgi:hypothetical protein
MPARKPTGGFIEVGEYLDGAYAYEGSVEFFAGSDHCVYALVANHLDDLPTIDALTWDSTGAAPDRVQVDRTAPRTFDLRAGWQFAGPFKLKKGRQVIDVTADDIITDGECQYAADSGGYWPIDPPRSAEPQTDRIRCPKCGSESISVVQVSCTQHTKPHTGHWPLTLAGFAWDDLIAHRDGSTEDEIAECDDCRYCCPAGALHEFGFGAQPPVPNGDDDNDKLECAECGEPITATAEAESTYCGSMHPDCATEHRSHCTICNEDGEPEEASEAKDYADMDEDELAEVKGRFSVDDGPEGEFACLLDAIHSAEGLANGKHRMSHVYDNTNRLMIWEVDGRE